VLAIGELDLLRVYVSRVDEAFEDELGVCLVLGAICGVVAVIVDVVPPVVLPVFLHPPVYELLRGDALLSGGYLYGGPWVSSAPQ